MIRPLVAVFLVALGLAALEAQEARQTFRSATRLVEVPVVVTDRQGKPVTTLTKDDFIVHEDRALQEISFFETMDRPSVVNTTFRDPADRVFTNRAPGDPVARSVILLDRLNNGFENQWHAREHVQRYLETLPPTEQVALYVLDGGLTVLHDFSADASSLRRALDSYEARVLGEYDASQEPGPSAGQGNVIPVWLADPSRSMSEFFQRRRHRHTFESLQVLASHLAAIAGRKSVIWVSEVFPMPRGLDRPQFMADLRETIRDLSDAQAAVYTVDARGLVGAIAYAGSTTRFTTFGEVRGNIETMDVISEETGGRSYWNTNGLAQSIRRAVDDTRFVYVLGYYPKNAEQDGRFRTISVKVRQKGLMARHRQGYLPVTLPLDHESRDTALREALARPLAATQIELSANTAYQRAAGRVTIDLRIDPAAISLDRDGAGWKGAVDILVADVARTGEGKITLTESLALALTDSQRSAALRDGLRVTLASDVSPSIHQLRIIARDVGSGRVGSLVISAADVLR